MEKAIIILMVLNVVLTSILILKGNTDKNSKDISNLYKSIRDIFTDMDSTIKDEFSRNRQENSSSRTQSNIELSNNLKNISDIQRNQLDSFSKQLLSLTNSNEEKLNKMRETIETRILALQNGNDKKLEEIRNLVDEKLNESLDKKLTTSFSSISQRLEILYKQLGEIGSLANGVNDLKRALTNIKVRGTFGEIQLNSILEDILTREQYETNVATKKGSNERVEFAIKIPSKDEKNQFIYLPIDSKFPQEDYQKLLSAEEKGDKLLVDQSKKALIARIKSEAQDVSKKYLDPPNTTDFGIIFLPTESLYSEVVKEAGLMEQLQKKFKIIVTGPSTIAAFLNSLQMGFRTLAIERRSSEVWELLGAVKTQFSKFGDILEKTQKKLQEASNTIETASRKSRTIERKLRSVEELPLDKSSSILEAKE
ncbi:DNA recombination protein RmuC [Clostridium luticellarii]|uniref:RmuC family protein n=1 Tax=Clostridium luticellarii TaxID=1691940 RepID=A0A2T0BRY9_9CLOT|nr:DNA recombination protein RmuC [Clostridium luticellarii]MCI1943653.1 DNA recombination protein RmuC [Clostridium luticellarii]MCI1969620.1 DNA recombination protein RmuC [Clostridium luticellarii]MCI1996596.1 DNA recombination protein RmuC [Clostridium luticellarii]MCI2038766.1 DNA recombination protein RmuC [Clostridium luticellarii]PRR86643.1 RmuC family protein [Clostridium luticellarii]